jgi:hypothetical protein
MAEINLDAFKAARVEARPKKDQKPHTVRFGGKVFKFAVLEQPFALAEGIAFARHDRIIEGLQLLLGPKGWAAFDALGPSDKDIADFAEAAANIFGFGELGESEASGRSSPPTSDTSRPTSNGSTGSTSAKRSGGKKP